MPDRAPPLPGLGAAGAPGWAAASFDARGLRERWLDGEADLAAGRRVEETTRFRWFSVTKLATAMTILALADEGALDLDDPVARYLPWTAGGSPRPLRALLSHTGGVANPSAIRWARPPGAPARSAAQLTREAYASLRRAHRPPSPDDARYSNLGYLLLGEAIAAATGAPFERACRRHVLEPLGLTRTSFAPTDAAVGHERLPSARALVMSALFLPRTPALIRYARRGWVGLAPYALEGAAYGGLVGSLDDLARLGRALLDPRWGRMHAEAGRGADGARFGLGPELYEDGWLGHGGAAGGYRAELRVHPGRGLGVAVLANGGDAAAEEVAARIAARL